MSEPSKLRPDPNWRARTALTANLVGGADALVGALVDLFKSDVPIDREVRDLLADALLRGRAGAREDRMNEEDRPMPWLRVEGMGKPGAWSAAVLTRKNKLEAVRKLEELRAVTKRGERGDKAKAKIASQYGCDVEWMNKAIRYRNDVKARIKTPNSAWVDGAQGYFGFRREEMNLNDPQIYRMVETFILYDDAETGRGK